MAKKGYKISKEIKDQIINRIKHNGVSVAEAAKDAGISTGTIYTWLGTQARGTVSILEHNKLKKENQQLKELLGEITLRLSEEQKRG
jgi:transposase-like protein